MVLDASAVWDFAREVVTTLRPRQGRTLATVTRVDPDGTTWVTTGDGGEAPASTSSAGAAVGDTVEVGWDGSSMSVRANVSNPAPAGNVVSRAITQARGIAEAARRVASAVNQHFWTDGAGIHVTQVTQEEWTDADRATYHSGPNVLINSIGQLFRDGLNNLLTMTTEDGARAMAVWDGLGNGASNILAYFGEMVRIGRSNQGHVAISTHESTELRDPSYAEMSLFGADGATKDIRIYSRDAAIGDDFDDYDLLCPAAGIEFMGGHTVGKTSIYTMDEDQYGTGNPDNHLYITNGSKSVTTDSSVEICSQRKWIGDDSKYNLAEMWTSTGASGNYPSAGISVQSGDKVTDVYVRTSSSASTAYVHADRAYVADNLITTAIGWTNLPLSTQAKAWTEATAPRYRRHLGIVQLTGEASPKSAVEAGGTITIGTLPVGCRPPRRINVLCNGSGNREWLLAIDPDGTVNASRYRLGAAGEEMPTNAWLPFHVMFTPADS